MSQFSNFMAIAVTGNTLSQGGGGWQSRLGTDGFRIFGGRMGSFNNATQKTFQVTAELQTPNFRRVKLIIANANTTSRGIGGASVAVLANTTDLNGASATHVKVTFGGQDTGTVPGGASATRRGFLVSDWVDIDSVARDDAGVFPLILGRIYESSSATIQVQGNGTDSFTNWASRTDGNLWAMRYNDGNCCEGTGTPADFASTTAQSQCGLIGFIFETKNGEKVCTIAGFGDSILEGRGTYLGEGFGVPMCEDLRTTYPSIAFSWANLGWATQNTTNAKNHVIDAFASGLLPDVAMFSNGSPNDPGNAPITDGQVTTMTTNRDTVLASCRSNDVHPLVWTWLPTNPAVNDYGSSDSKRTAFNAATVADGVANDYQTADFSTTLSGTTDGDGQVGMLAGSTSDNIHPNDTGNALLAAVGAAAAPLALARAA